MEQHCILIQESSEGHCPRQEIWPSDDLHYHYLKSVWQLSKNKKWGVTSFFRLDVAGPDSCYVRYRVAPYSICFFYFAPLPLNIYKSLYICIFSVLSVRIITKCDLYGASSTNIV